MNRSGEGSIGVIGIVAAVLIILVIRGCATDYRQQNINDYCVHKGFEYGKETVRTTIITCDNINESQPANFPYQEMEEYRKARKEEKRQ